MDPVLVGLIGVIIGGVFTSFGNWLANHFALKREEKLWQRQEQQRAKDREADSKKSSSTSYKKRIPIPYQISLLTQNFQDQCKIKTKCQNVWKKQVNGFQV